MVFQKRFEYVSTNGYQIPAMPRVPRSAKGKRSARKKVEDNQMCAFDLLASLAGKILAEREGLWTPCKTAGVTNSVHANMKEALGDESTLKGGGFDQVSCDESTFSPFAPHGQTSYISQLHLKNPESKSATYTPLLAKSDASKKDASANDFIASGAKGARLPNKCLYSTNPMVSCVCKVDDTTVVPLQGGRQRTGCLLCGDAFRIQKLEDPMDLDQKPATLLMSSDSSIEIPPYGDHRSSSFPSVRDGMESHADRDDGENSSGCTYPSSVHSKSFKAHRTGESRIRKMVTSNYRKADPASYDDGELSNDDGETKTAFRKQKLFYTRQRTRRSSFKRRRMFERCSVSASRGSCGDEAVVDSQVKDGIRLEATDLLAALNGANNISCTRRTHNLSYESTDYPVKLSIKSFRVPEFFIEIPSNATVGSLKRTVMEAVMAILGDGLRVGVLLQGKKVRDDNKTLRQAGISHEDNKMDSLGFTLEPKPACSAPPHNSPEVPPCFLPCEPPPLKKLQAPGNGLSNAALRPPPIPISTTNCRESDHVTVHSPPIDPCSSSAAAESKALIPMAAVNAEALAVIPLRRHSDIIQRRIRRPFSVSEVEALVQAVEKLGTGRWRDVKLRAFDNAKHRTYVDLKDKWKTLVHTARISPQQRRGEPVPQELLDRVLSAHAYWSQQQPRLPCHADRCLLA